MKYFENPENVNITSVCCSWMNSTTVRHAQSYTLISVAMTNSWLCITMNLIDCSLHLYLLLNIITDSACSRCATFPVTNTHFLSLFVLFLSTVCCFHCFIQPSLVKVLATERVLAFIMKQIARNVNGSFKARWRLILDNGSNLCGNLGTRQATGQCCAI